MYGFELKDIYKEGLGVKDSLARLEKNKDAFLQFEACAKLLQDKHPEVCDEILENAEDAYAGYFLLPGSAQKTFIGDPPKWTENPNNNKEYEYQLNRMNHWLVMTYAYFLTQDMKFVDRIVLEIETWIDQCPPPLLLDEDGAIDVYGGPNGKWWRILECGIRLYKTWGPVIEAIAPLGVFDESLFTKITEILYFQVDLLARFSPILWPEADHNHFLMENLGLMKASGMFTEWKNSAKWKEHAKECMCRAMKAQVLDYGAQIEGCPSYHNGCTFWFSLGLKFGRSYGIEFPSWYEEMLSSMGIWALYCTRPDGNNVGWGDTGVLTGTMAKSAVCIYIGTSDPRWLDYSAYMGQENKLWEELSLLIWHMADPKQFLEDFENALENPVEPPLDPLVWNKSMKQACYRSDWSGEALSIFFSARSPVQNLHAHIDPLAFDLCAFGKPLLTDPGRYTYQEGPDRENFKRMFWHNTLMVNEKDAWKYLASWKYGPMKTGDILSVGEKDGLHWLVGYHDNYEPVRHERLVASLEDKYVLVLDKLTNLKAGDSLSMQYNFDGLEAKEEGSGFVCQNHGINTYLVSTMPPAEIAEAAISDRNDEKRPTSLLVFRNKMAEDSNVLYYATLIIPTKSGAITVSELTLEPKANGVELSIATSEDAYQLSYDADHYELKRR